MAKEPDHGKDEILDEAVRQFLAAQWRGEKPDLDAFVQQYPGLEANIRRKVQACQQVGSLFDSIRQADETEFRSPGDGRDLVGRQLGAFEITEVIGRGGMGIVYKGHDTRLNRTVAIKAMPSHLAKDTTARTRFRREAMLLASLNHANIGLLYDVIEQGEDLDYLVLEYVPGETLAERIAHGPMRVDEALSAALQIAEAVAAAHERGVIHRDLKPGNMIIGPEGKVKVLDFGLARAVASEPTTGETAVTQPGRLIGTPAYMSPEQARGKPAERRTDIWSFGCVLYEMLTGQLPFEGETATDILARIIERQPDWDQLPPKTPANIRVLLRRCLAKEPHRRLQHMGDAVLEINDALTVPADETGIGEPAVGKARRLLWWLAAAWGIAGLTVGLITAGLFSRGSSALWPSESSPAFSDRAIIKLPEGQVLGLFKSAPLGVRRLAFDVSPDGSRLVYVADLADDRTQLFLHFRDQWEGKPIPGTDGASSPFFSPNGQSVAYFADDKLKVVSLRGGEPETLCDALYPQTGSWGDDGMIYFAGGGGLSRVPAAHGKSELLAGTTSTFISEIYPQILPGGKAVLVSSERDILLVSLETMERRRLVKDAFCARYVPTGHLVYAQAGAIKAAPFSLATLGPTGPAVPVIERVLSDSLYGAAQFAFSNNGVLVYVPGGDTAKSIPTWVDRQDREETPLDMPPQNYGTPSLSPDGKLLAIIVNELQSDVYVYDVATGLRMMKLTMEGNNVHPVWTPDGQRVTFGRLGEGQEDCHILWMPVDGSGEATSLYSSQRRMFPCSWSPDGTLLAFSESDPSTSVPDITIRVLSLEGDGQAKLVSRIEFKANLPAFSAPGAQWMAYTSTREGRFQVYVTPYPAMNRTIPISYGLGEEPVWSRKGDELFYRSGSRWMAASISTEPEFEASTPEMLFEGTYVNVSGMSYDVAPDGQRFIVLKPQEDDSQIRELRVVNNWFEELKRRVPPPEAP